MLYGTKGTLDEWFAEVAARTTGNTRLIFALSVAFSGPIFDLLEAEPIGVHYVGASSTGKSTATFAGGSVWGGGGRNGFCQSWRSTGNSLEGTAKAHSGTCLCLEEINEVDSKEVGSIAYMLVNGHGKGRATKDGEARARAEWRMPILSSGETGIAAKIREGRGTVKQGQLVRSLAQRNMRPPPRTPIFAFSFLSEIIWRVFPPDAALFLLPYCRNATINFSAETGLVSGSCSRHLSGGAGNRNPLPFPQGPRPRDG